MAVFAVSITKELDWRGQAQQFSNIYHLNTNVGQIFDDIAAIDALVAAERPIFSNNVRFKVARTWGPTNNGQAASLMRDIKDLTGIGQATSSASAYKEMAILARWPLGRYGSRNRPQFLRKWLHTNALHGYPPDGSDPLTSVPTALQTYLNAVTFVNPPGLQDGYELCSWDGKLPTGPATLTKYLEHRQFGR